MESTPLRIRRGARLIYECDNNCLKNERQFTRLRCTTLTLRISKFGKGICFSKKGW